MRLSDWRGRAPHKDAMAPKVAAALDAAVGTLGADPDPSSWVAWGDDPSVRYHVLIPTADGLIQAHVRVNVPGEGPRVSAKVTRWSRVQVGELAIEVTAGHRLMTFQVEGQVLRGPDADAEAIALFARQVFAAQDGRPMPEAPARQMAKATTKAPSKAPTRRATTAGTSTTGSR